jgi:hypothetical protein
VEHKNKLQACRVDHRLLRGTLACLAVADLDDQLRRG